MITKAAAVIPRLPDGRVLVGVRTLSARSFPGSLAFPGGAVDDGDERLPRASEITEEAAERAAALRELGEETGRWFVCLPGGARAGEEVQRAFATALLEGATLADALHHHALVLDDRQLVSLGRWRTPDFLPRRFDLRQFLLLLDGEPPAAAPPTDELTEVGFREVPALFDGWQRGDVLLLPPIRFVLRGLHDAARAGDDEAALAERLRKVPVDGAPELRDLIAGVAVQPYRTPTLPPATHTNTVLVGAGDFVIIDPATPYDDERARFDALLAQLEEDGRRPLAIVLTHHHEDHVSDAARLVERRGLPVWAHAKTAALVDLRVERHLEEGDVIELPGAPRRALRVLFTPGHAPGHVCLLEEETGVLIAGDMVASTGSILINPPEGHMGTYLASLSRLLDERPRRVVPSHGPLLADGPERLQVHVEHRRRRQRQVLEALPADAPGATPSDLVPPIYGGEVPSAAFPLAARSVLACAELLVEEGSARQRDGRFWRA